MQILPSGRGPADRGAPGLVLAPFHGVRYAEDRVSGLAQVTSPPYDVIAGENEDQLLAADLHNVVRIIRPRRAPGRPGTSYDQAAAGLRRWLADGIVVPDSEPGLYVYEQVLPRLNGPCGPDAAQPGAAETGAAEIGGRAQRGLIGALRLEPDGSGIIQAHEGISPGPVAGRLKLMEATSANLEPIFLLYDGAAGDGGGDGAATRIVAEVACTRPPLAQARSADGSTHRLWAITESGELARIAADLRPRSALIADGHHRYAAYLELQHRQRLAGRGSGPWDFGLALLVDSAAYPPQVGAIHRVIPGLACDGAARLAAAAFCVRELPGGPADTGAALRALEAAGTAGVAFLLGGGERCYLLTDPDPAQVLDAMRDEPAEPWHRLAGAVLQELLMRRIWRVRDEETQPVHDPATALREARDACAAGRAAAATAVLCSPVSAADVHAVAAQGRLLPRKSTSFGPKPRTGLVFRLFAED
ncbi:MAG TPA: DUF1015 domain-containing protein [Streptosporangiaceae bacterium]